ncbi:MAG TPA: trigger factor [Vicinamibacterales bacterium]|nr:trigger factor [Vicinamibacterales bacterium]
MKSELVDVNETRRDLAIEVPSEVVDEAIGHAAAKLGRSARIPGFRPGKVPATVIRQRFKPQIMQDVAEHLISKAVGDALTEKGVEPIATPDIKDLVLEEGKPLTFKATFDVVPSFDPGDLSTIAATRPSATVDDDAVNQALDRIRERNARYEAVEGGAVEAGHTVVVSLERQGTDKDGQKGETDKHEQVNIELGAPSNPPGFDEQVLGMTPGATKSFTISYPADYTIAELAGSTVEYTVTLKEIKKRVVPALDDELAKDLGEFESLDALRAHVRHDLEHEAQHAAEHQVRAEVLKQLAGRVPFAVPESLVEREIDRRLEDFARRLMDQRIDPRQANIDWNAFRDAQRAPATEAVGSAIALDEIARREHIEVSDEDLNAELQRYADRTGHSVASIRARLQKDGELGRVAAGLRREKAVLHTVERAQIKTS